MEKGFSADQYEDELGKKNLIISKLELQVQILILRTALEIIAADNADDPVVLAKSTLKKAVQYGLLL